MAVEKTFAIIKPDATARNITGKIISRIEEEGFMIRAMKKVWLTKAEAQCFYAVHQERPFYDSLTTFMSSGPVIVLCLEAENAIARWREVMGATNPADAADGTLRATYGVDLEKNSTHGSDAQETAATELAYFFGGIEYV